MLQVYKIFYKQYICYIYIYVKKFTQDRGDQALKISVSFTVKVINSLKRLLSNIDKAICSNMCLCCHLTETYTDPTLSFKRLFV